MNHAEVDAFARWASPDTMQAVGSAGIAAQRDWLVLVLLPWELHHGAPYRRCPMIFPGAAARAAGIAAAEVAVVCRIWPDSLDEVLRPSVQSTFPLPYFPRS